jgi:hypothetical protein
MGMVDDVVPTEPEDRPPGGPEPCVTVLVMTAVEEAVVECSTVDFDDDPCFPEHEVNATDPRSVITQVDLSFRFGQPEASRQLDEPHFELALGRHVPLAAFIEQGAEEHGPAASVLCEIVEHPPQRRNRDHAASQRCVQRSFRAACVDVATQIEQRPRDGRAGHRVDDLQMVLGKRKRLLEAHPFERTPVVARNRDGEWFDRKTGQAVQRGRAPVRESCAIARRQDRRECSLVRRGHGTGEPEDTSSHPTPTTAIHPMPYPASTDSEREGLSTCDETVLRGCKRIRALMGHPRTLRTAWDTPAPAQLVSAYVAVARTTRSHAETNWGG